MKLTPHFSLEELTQSDTAVRLGIDNTPPDELIPNLTKLANGLETIRHLLGDRVMHVNSGFRCEELERVITAKDYARWCVKHGHQRNEMSWQLYFATKGHPQGYSADWICAAYGNPNKIVSFLAKSDLQFDQLITEGVTASGAGWCHSSFDPRMRRSVLTATFVNGVPHYTQGVAS